MEYYINVYSSDIFLHAAAIANPNTVFVGYTLDSLFYLLSITIYQWESTVYFIRFCGIINKVSRLLLSLIV